MRGVSAAGEQELADLAWFLEKVGLNKATVVDPDVDVQKVDMLLIKRGPKY